MPKRQRYTATQLVKRLEKAGFEKGRKANHGTCMTKPGQPRPIIVPKHGGETLPVGLSQAILKQAGIEDN